MLKIVVLVVANIIFLSQTSAKTVQNETVGFPGIGLVKISAEEPDQGWVHVRFTLASTGRTVATISADKSNNSFRAEALSSIRFQVLHITGFPDPLILSIVHATGASDCAYQVIPIGVVHGKITNLSPEPLSFATQGGVYLGEARGMPRLALWYVDSINDVEHYAPHKYHVQFFSRNPKTGLFERSYARNSRRVDSERQAAESFGFKAEGIVDVHRIVSWFREFGC